MDRRERYVNIYSYIQQMIDTALLQTWCAMPGIVQSFNAQDCTAQVQLAIRMQNRDKNNNWTDINPSPVIPKALVCFPGNKNYIFTFPIAAGDEGLLVFADRCIDAWWQSGGVQSQLDIRNHDLTDGIFFPGVRSLPNVPNNINPSAAEFRTSSGNTKIAFSDAGGIVMTASSIAFNAPVTSTGNITAGFGTSDSVTLQGHKHTANNTPPTPGT